MVHLYYSKETLVSAARPLRFVRERYLAPSLVDEGWPCYIFRLEKARGGSHV